MRAGFVEEIALSGVILLCVGVSPNIFVAAQAGYANMETLALLLLLPSLGVLAATLGLALWRGHRRLSNRVLAGLVAGVIGTVGLEAVRITSFRVFNGMPGDIPQLLGVLLLNRFMEGPSTFSTILGRMFQPNPVLRIAIMRCKINGFRVLSAVSFSWLLLRLGAVELP
ncbi:MAG: hypothetical protein M0Z50_04560, partial [Planctomycetia bacterium]|nr:hypothetical protein [Planctomycetia bacterium]